jgi:hypothetical protein
MILSAYDMEMLPARAVRGSVDDHGWCFGLPPGIKSAQWPLDHRTGQPMRHAFTLLLPEDYRAQGPELMALSFFDTDWTGDGPTTVPEISRFFENPTQSAPADKGLLPMSQYTQAQHTREYRMRDILDEEYAVIWLTESEFNGPLCLPPIVARNGYWAHNKMPDWMTKGAAAAFYEARVGDALDTPEESKRWLHPIFGGRPVRGATDYAIRWSKRPNDPNAGKQPPKGWLDAPVSESGYVRHYHFGGAKDYHVLDWSKAHKPNHIGGTMQPVQAYPGFSPFYIEFEEWFGGFNFGGGNAQLDLQDMKIDWACG